MNGYFFWIRVASILQVITACVHALSFLRTPVPANDTERLLHELMTTYRPDLGPHFHPTMADLFNALSACFTFLYLFAGMVNLYLLPRGLAQTSWKGLISINLLIFGAAFLVMLLLTFILPIIFTGAVFIALCLAYATNHIHRFRLPEN